MKMRIIASGGLSDQAGKIPPVSTRSILVTLVVVLFGAGLLAAAGNSRSTVAMALLGGAGMLALAFALFRMRRLAACLPGRHTTHPQKLYSCRGRDPSSGVEAIPTPIMAGHGVRGPCCPAPIDTKPPAANLGLNLTRPA